MAKILVVEDDMMNAKLFQLILSRKGNHEVVLAKDADQAIEYGTDPTIDLIIMDISLQNWEYGGREVDGIDLTRMIKGEESSRDTPVLLVTAHAMRQDKERFLRECDAEDYFAKPIKDHGKFLSKVQSLLSAAEVV